MSTNQERQEKQSETDYANRLQQLNLLNPLTYDDLILNRSSIYILACSGGIDSVVLTYLYSDLYRIGKIDKPPVLFHLNHGLRLSANRDQSFVEDLAKKLILQLHGDTIQIEKLARRSGLNLEEAGRLIRYRRLFDLTEKLGDPSIVVTAHHADDYIESIILKILRGATDRSFLMPLISRLTIRKKKSIQIFRPLLRVNRSQIEDYASCHSIQFCQDETNFSSDYRRNRIRQTILPLLKKEGLDSARLWRQVNGSIKRFGKDELASIDYLGLPIDLLNGATATEFKWVIDQALNRLQLGPMQGNYQGGLLFEILSQSKQGRVRVQTNEFQIWSSTKTFWIIKNDSEMLIKPVVTYLNESIQITTGFKIFHYANPDQLFSVKFFEDGMLTVTGKKLKRIFQQRDVPLPIRRKIPLLVENESQKVKRILFSVKKLGDDDTFIITKMS